MNKLDETLIKQIINFSSNEDIFKIEKINKFFNSLFDKKYRDYLKYRWQPLVFNQYDNRCNVCNIKPFFFINDPFNFIKCKHN